MKLSVPVLSLLFATAILAVAPAVGAASSSSADPDAKCLKCHGKKLKKQLEDGGTMFLQIDAANFESSVHRVIGCTGCHRDVAGAKHPSRVPIASRRAYSLERNQACSQCHAAKYTAYEGSVHAHMVAEGNGDAPLCSDCHGSHAIQSRAVYEPVSGEPCSKCHEAIYEAYEQSVHGQARANGNRIRADHVRAPICADCHQAHDISAVAATGYLRTTCLSCHDEAAAAHQKWLPNAAMHMASVSCDACHSPAAERRVDLQLYDKLSQVPVGSNPNDTAFGEALSGINAGGDALNPVELWKLVRRGSRNGQPVDVTLRGRMEVSTGMDAHRIAPSSQAVRSCESCHQQGSDAFRNVTVSISRPDGRKQRFAADEKVLRSAVSVDSVGEFYAPGGTRIGLLDGLLVFAVVGGLAVPIGHITLGRILRRKQGKQ